LKSNLEWALFYIAKGFSVFPLKPNDKIPATKDGFKSATKDTTQIMEWWTANPYYNIGVATGQASGIVVVDVDVKEAVNGAESLDEWQEQNGLLPQTLTNYTGSGGLHYIYKTDKKIKNRTNVLPGIDVRGDGGYIVVPPSIHPNGNPYEWENGKHAIAEADETVLKLIKFKAKSEKVSGNQPKTDTVIPKGQRVDRLVSWIGTLVQLKLPDNFIRMSIKAMNAEQCIPPLSDAEMEQNVYPALNRFLENSGKEEMKSMSALDLYTKDIPPLKWYVQDLLPTGTNLLVAPPKTNKSWFALAAGLAIAKGERFLGFDTAKSGVLYLALEDSERRLQNRMQKLLKGTNIPQDFYFVTKAKTLNTGLVNDLEKFMQEHPKTGFIIIDTLQKVRDITKNQNAYASDYKDLAVLKDFADKHDICLLIIHHTRKMKDTDVFNNISGTNGVLGAVDTAIIFTKEKREDARITMDIAGRDVYAETYVLHFENYEFAMLGKAKLVNDQKAMVEYSLDPVVRTARALLKDNCDTWSGTASEFGDAMRKKGFGTMDDKDIGRTLKAIANDLYNLDNISYTCGKSNGKKKHHLVKRLTI